MEADKPLKKKRRSWFWEGIAIILVIFLFAAVIIRYSPPLRAVVVDAGLDALSTSRSYAPINSTLNYINQYIPLQGDRTPDYAALHTYINHTQLEKEYAALDIKHPEEDLDTLTTSIVVLNYHGTVASDQADDYSIAVEDFKRHMFALKQEGYKTLDSKELYEFLRGERQLYGKYFVLTFDDGIRDTYYNVDPILKLLDYEAVMFVIAGQSVEKNTRYYLNKDELREMQSSGRWDIQSHSYNAHHKIVIDRQGNTGPFLSNKMWLSEEARLETDDEYETRIRNDLLKSKQLIEAELNKSVDGFALPFGEFGQRESNYYDAEKVIIGTSRNIFDMVFYQFKPATNKDFRANYNNKRDDFYLVMRISADAIKSPEDLIREMNAAQSLQLPYSENFDNPKRWISLWGDLAIENDELLVSNSAGTFGSMAYLDGSYPWKNYEYDITLDVSSAEKIILLTRFQDSYNYAGCRFTNSTVSIINVRERVKNTYADTRINMSAFVPGTRLTSTVLESNITCSVNGVPVLSQDILHMPENGGVGVRVESLNDTVSPTVFRNISIIPR